MLPSAAALLFIGAAAGAAVYVGTRPTIADGRVMAASMREGKPNITSIECDDKIPIGVSGAVFTCAIAADDGSTARIEYKLDRAGALSAKVLESTNATHRSPRKAGGGDPWTD